MGTFVPPHNDCAKCPRLKELRDQLRIQQPTWHNSPVPSFGCLHASVLIVGLAPGREGANRTGRPFTSDYAGDLLYPMLIKHGFAKGTYAEHKDDGLELINCRITNAVRCLPPQNKPTTQEMKNCRGFLKSEMDSMPNVKTILTLGRIAHEQVCRALNEIPSHYIFAHGAEHKIAKIKVINSYHCSRYNTNTGRLTEAMFEDVIIALKAS